MEVKICRINHPKGVFRMVNPTYIATLPPLKKCLFFVFYLTLSLHISLHKYLLLKCRRQISVLK